tara:strand:+ start:1255 stop:1419 length:165 start_codon:yes stop_codon:yes gene_type:complete
MVPFVIVKDVENDSKKVILLVMVISLSIFLGVKKNEIHTRPNQMPSLRQMDRLD